MLTACEWWDVFVDQQAQVRRGVSRNGVWHLEVAAAGEYEIELRRWPREAQAAMSAGFPAQPHAFGKFPAGIALPVARARLRVGSIETARPVEPGDEAAVFRVWLSAGPTTLQTWPDDASGRELCGAYYAYVSRRR
mgnify:CR=1 FL=1